MTRTLQIAIALFCVATSPVLSQFTNLPEVPPGIFTASTRIEIQSTAAAAWDALTNFPAYANWNPFVRAAIVVDPTNLTLPSQYPVENRRLYLRTQAPPLPLPVSSSTPDNILHTQVAYENITHVQPQLGRLAWRFAAPDELLDAERWQAVSDIGDGKVLYESREVFSGALAEVLKEGMGKALQEAFEAQGKGLKLLLEGGK
ncbi:hypothetical protein K505DRAFT_270275 [Melanomma pulvis-pyrius CBS 109.77]|uniref:Coenzyme Q-binding protein COQ10 START domain-containing protein n=1 Tax=Melanomma pulvis-pyrius CBS 109.77 TaxID=1314802 RepID=A0A6A6XLG3_9PLEO|nr:hypothetical protein K505DRAFT_270275 [Melanomma pulvis-pyrius CBS 109.77]